MKVIIAPSKTMKPRENNFIKEPIIFPQETKYLHSLLQQYNDEELCKLMNISYKQALKVHDYFHKPQNAYPALSLYQGTVFKQLELSSYYEHLDYLDQYVRIMSAYYGIAKYNTEITPYRLDMTMKLPIQLYDYWYTPIYKYFEVEDFIISLASQEFTSMIHHPHLYFIDFIELKDGKQKRNAMIIKKARGQMLNQMILNEIKTLKDIKELNIDDFVYCEEFNQHHTLAFVRKSV